MTADELRSELADPTNVVLLAVREPWEVAEVASPGAVNIPLGSLAQRVHEVPRDRKIVVVCRSGNRSRTATDALDRAGWNAFNLKGGLEIKQVS